MGSASDRSRCPAPARSLWHKNDWAAKHKIYIGNGEMVRGPYSEHLLRSRFCLVLPGDGWSPRAEDAVLHGCIPVVVGRRAGAGAWRGDGDGDGLREPKPVSALGCRGNMQLRCRAWARLVRRGE